MQVFAPMSPAERVGWAPRYLAWLRARDGVPELETRRLPRREVFFTAFDGVMEPHVDAEAFGRNVRRKRPEPGLDTRTLWALAVAKVNRAERYGVELKLRIKGYEAAGAEDPYTFVELQELYHSRIFATILRTVGVETDILPPSRLTKVVVTCAGSLPHVFSDVVALAAELAGVAAFRMLRDEARGLFAEHPAVVERIELLFRQILVDEVGHVAFLRSRLGPVRLGIARLLLPWVTRGMIDDMPELVALLGRERFLAEVAKLDVTGPVATYPERLTA